MKIYFAGSHGWGGKKREARWLKLMDARLLSFYDSTTNTDSRAFFETLEMIDRENLFRRDARKDKG